ncbi:MAG: helix-turn-helix transcriptional regulator [Spirochaetes bacterium]|nr:helix-turn-helix transcriptional regulator [Spirochaetota bacterium]
MIRFIVCNYKNTIMPHESLPAHAHDFWQIDWIHDGSVELDRNGMRRIDAGQMAVIAPGVMHRYLFPEKTVMSALKFMPHFRFSVSGGAAYRQLTGDMQRILSAVFEEYHSAHRHAVHIASQYTEIFLYKYIIGRADETDALMEAAARYLTEHRGETISDRTAAETHGLSVNHFIKRFREYHGVTPAHYLRNIRVEHAKEMLLFRDASILEIARASGYTDAASFGKIFKKTTGIPPAKYRDLSV